jgi:hypothetical protein
MSAFTNYLERKLTEHSLGILAFTMPATVHVALHTADPTEVGNIAELAGGSYARQSATFAWNVGNARAQNSALIRFDGLPAGTITHFSIWDAASAGNCLYKGALTANITVASGASAECAANSLTVTLD